MGCNSQNIIRFSGEGPVKTKTAGSVTLRTQSINTAATTTLTIQGQTSGLVQTITVSVKADAASTTPPDKKQDMDGTLGSPAQGPKNSALGANSGNTGGGY